MSGARGRKETDMETDNRPKERRTCGTCRWYDPLGDLCRNPAGPHEWENMERGMTCERWEADT